MPTTFGITACQIAVPVTAVVAVAMVSMVVTLPPTVVANVAPVFGVGSISSATCRLVAPVLTTATVIETAVGMIRARLVKSLVLAARRLSTGYKPAAVPPTLAVAPLLPPKYFQPRKSATSPSCSTTTLISVSLPAVAKTPAERTSARTGSVPVRLQATDKPLTL